MTAIVPRFSVARYRLSLRPRETLHVPACNKGTMLRGAFEGQRRRHAEL